MPSPTPPPLPAQCDENFFISEYAEGSGYNKYLELYNAGTCSIHLDDYAFASTSDSPTIPGVYEFWNVFALGATLEPGGVYIIAHPSADATIVAKADETHKDLSNGNDGYCIVKGTESDYTMIDCVGNWDADPGAGWDVCGTSSATKDHTLVRKSSVTVGNGGNWASSAGTDTDNCEWEILPKNDWTYLGLHNQFVPSPTPVVPSNTPVAPCASGTVKNDWSDAVFGNGIGECVSVTPTIVTLPLPANASFASAFGQLVSVKPDEGFQLVVTDHYQLGRFAQFTVCAALIADGRRFQFTQRKAPGPDFILHSAEKVRSCIVVDDNSNEQNPAVIDIAGNIFGGAKGGNTMKTLLIGTPITNLTGFFQRNNFGSAVRATNLVFAVAVSDLAVARPTSPPSVKGDVIIVTTNVLNYFTTLTSEDKTARGADTPAEFTRQSTKISLALAKLNADLFGVMEVENTNTGAEDLAAKVNSLNPLRNYTAVGKDEPKIGTDAIRSDFIYDTNTLELLEYKTLDDSNSLISGLVSSQSDGVIFGKNGSAGKSRVPVAATFKRKKSADTFTAIVNHFKSKGSSCGSGDDDTQGAGPCNGKRLVTAKALVLWIESDAFFKSKNNVVIMGDLNSYANEAPVLQLLSSGFSTPIDLNSAYSFQFDGESGTLDYALFKGLAVVDSAIWHVNADEPNLLDYNLDFKKDALLFDSTSPYRFSDHDPVLLGLTFA